MFIDVHCHLDSLQNIERFIERAKKKRVKLIVANGVNEKSNRLILELAGKFKEVKAALGVYPIEALNLSDAAFTKELEFIRKRAATIVAIGEVGMDFKESEEKERQRGQFRAFIRLARDIDKPLIVHSRKAEEACIELLEEEKAEKVVMHCFCGKKRLVERIMANGWSFSIPANCVYSEQFQLIIKLCPLPQLLCETDSPYLHPEKEFPNEPANVVRSYETIARLKGLKMREVEKEIEGNYRRLFGKL
ncbi:MAG TPA: TatD family hydrolase [Candidatus Nanoarchaeia archaeon]|nr:TatD family hydrolase [Candidatus Nanoarchaeia archaeon]